MKQKDRCGNCGDPTNLKNATGDRAKKGWCVGCYRQFTKYCTETGDGPKWREPRGLHGRRPFDSR